MLELTVHARHACGILITVRSPHVALGSLLAVGAIGLTVGAVWVVGIPAYACDEGVPSPNAWIYAGFVLFALGLPALAFRWMMLLRESVHRYYTAIAVGEAVVSLALAVYLASKYGHYRCG